jgi:hypothetical protein
MASRSSANKTRDAVLMPEEGSEAQGMCAINLTACASKSDKVRQAPTRIAPSGGNTSKKKYEMRLMLIRPQIRGANTRLAKGPMRGNMPKASRVSGSVATIATSVRARA